MMSENQIMEIIDELEDELIVVKDEYYNLSVDAEIYNKPTNYEQILTCEDIIHEKETILNIYKQILNNTEENNVNNKISV